MAYESSDHRTSTYWARVALLEAVREVKPEVLSELRDLLPFFRQAARYLQDHHGHRWDLWAWHVSESRRSDASVLQLRWAITAWAQDHNLNFDWCIGCAIYSLIEWDMNIGSFKYGWHYDGHSPEGIGDEERRFIFELEEDDLVISKLFANAKHC